MEFLFVTGFAALLFRGASSAGSQKNCFGGQNFPSLQLIKLVSVRYIYHSFPYSATMYIKIFRLLMVANLATISQSMVLCKENCKSGRVAKSEIYIWKRKEDFHPHNRNYISGSSFMIPSIISPILLLTLPFN